MEELLSILSGAMVINNSLSCLLGIVMQKEETVDRFGLVSLVCCKTSEKALSRTSGSLVLG